MSDSLNPIDANWNKPEHSYLPIQLHYFSLQLCVLTCDTDARVHSNGMSSGCLFYPQGTNTLQVVGHPVSKAPPKRKILMSVYTPAEYLTGVCFTILSLLIAMSLITQTLLHSGGMSGFSYTHRRRIYYLTDCRSPLPLILSSPCNCQNVLSL